MDGGRLFAITAQNESLFAEPREYVSSRRSQSSMSG
jgi:hypothetical protein